MKKLVVIVGLLTAIGMSGVAGAQDYFSDRALDQGQLQMVKKYLDEAGCNDLVPVKGFIAGQGLFYLTCKNPNGEMVRVTLTVGIDPKDKAKVEIGTPDFSSDRALDQGQLHMVKKYVDEAGRRDLVPLKGMMTGQGLFYLTCKNPKGEFVRAKLSFGIDPKDKAKIEILKW
jgi:hypothetical protein